MFRNFRSLDVNTLIMYINITYFGKMYKIVAIKIISLIWRYIAIKTLGIFVIVS